MPVGAVVHRFASVASTNDVAAALARQGAAHGTAVLAAAQTKGRGTKGRAWHSPAGLGLYASFILRGPEGGPVPHAHLVPLAAGLAAADAVLEAAGVVCGLKWPNDLIQAGKKLGGILSEAVSGGEGGGFVVVGIGLNVRHEAGDLPEDIRPASTSVRQAGGRDMSPEDLWPALCRALDHWYNVLTRGDKGEVIRAFGSRSVFPPGAAVVVETAGGTFEAEYRGLDAEGRLLVARGGAGVLALDAVLKLEPRP